MLSLPLPRTPSLAGSASQATGLTLVARTAPMGNTRAGGQHTDSAQRMEITFQPTSAPVGVAAAAQWAFLTLTACSRDGAPLDGRPGSAACDGYVVL